MSRLFVGWDVGGWHFDRNASSLDALVVTCLRGAEVVLKGKPWRGNLRSILMDNSGDPLVAAMLDLCDVASDPVTEVVIAIDTPLGWPSAMMRLAQGGATSFVSARWRPILDRLVGVVLPAS